MPTLDRALMTVFCTLWYTRSVTRTAARLDLSQSSVSTALKRLRAIFDDPLFVWDGHHMVATTRAIDVIEETRAILLALDALVARRAPGVAEIKRHFVIASADYVAALCGPALVDRFAAEAPGLVLEFVDVTPDMLGKGRAVGIDFFMMPAGRLRTDGLRSVHLYDDSYVCVGRRGNLNLEAAASDVDAFLALPHVGYSSVQRVVFSHESLAWRPDRQPSYKWIGPHYLSAALIAARSEAVVILPAQAVAALGPTLDLTQVVPATALSLPEIAMALYWSQEAERDPTHLWVRDALIAASRDAGLSSGAKATIASARLLAEPGG